MQNVDTKQFTDQLDSMFFSPARAYAALSVDYTEKLLNTQLEAGKAYTDASLALLRSLVNVKDAEGLRAYTQGQQQVAKYLTECLKGDAEKVVALQQDFVQQSRKLTESNAKLMTEASGSNAKQMTEAAGSNAKQVTEADESNAKQAAGSNAKQAKPTTRKTGK